MFFLQHVVDCWLADAQLPWFWLMRKQTKAQMCWELARVTEQGEKTVWSEAYG